MKLRLRLFSLVSFIFIMLNLYLPLFSNTNVISFNQQQVLPEMPIIKQSNQGYFNESGQEIFWFIQMSDVHYTGSIGSTSAIYMNNFFNDTYQEINPLFVINTGNIVLGNTNPWIGDPYAPIPAEWEGYLDVLETNNLNSSIYIDLIGNNDVSCIHPTDDYFLNYSMIGTEFNVTQYSFNKSFSFGDYAFITLDTTKDIPYATSIIDSAGLQSFDTTGYLYTENLDWYEAELEKYKDFDKIFVFGHNPYNRSIFTISSENTSISHLNFTQLNEKYNVSSYICGHSPESYITNQNGLFEIETTDFYNEGGTYRIIAVDNGQISTSIGRVGTWPQYVITYPPNNIFSPEDFTNEDNKIRVLAWDPDGINITQWSAFYANNNTQITEWANLTIVDGPLWEGEWNTTLNGRVDYKIKIRFTEDEPTVNPPDDTIPNNWDDLLGLLSLLNGLQFVPAIFITAGIFIIVVSITGTILHRRRVR